jgi:hypothetical protein
MTVSPRSYDVDVHDVTMKQVQWRAAQDPRARQREKAQRTANRIVSVISVAAATLAIYDLSRLVLGMH